MERILARTQQRISDEDAFILRQKTARSARLPNRFTWPRIQALLRQALNPMTSMQTNGRPY